MKRCLTIILSICMFFLSVNTTAYAYENASLPSVEITAFASSSDVNAAMESKILALKSKFPEGENWDPNGTGWNNRAWTCYGFAITMAGQIFTDYPTNAHIRSASNGKKVEGWTCYYVTKKNYESLVVEPGDILDCPTGWYRGADGKKHMGSHTAMVLSVDNGKITCVQANNGGNNLVYWTKCFNYDSRRSTLKNIYNDYASYITGSGSRVFRLWKPSEELKAEAIGYSLDETSTLSISNATYPGEIKKDSRWTCKGKISSNYKINQVTGYILSSDGGKVLYSKTVNPNAKSYSLANGAIDKALLFNKLPMGTYNYKITAKDTSGKMATLIDISFSVVGVPSTLQISGNSTLTSLDLGKSWTCNGTISSNYLIKQVYAAILESDGITAVYRKTVNPNVKNYKLAGSAIDKELKFNNLSAGTYYYVVDATDASGKKLNVVKNKFTVETATSTLKISGNSALTSLSLGQEWTCNGTINSNYKITQVYGAILESDGITVSYSKTINPNVNSVKLAGSAIDKELKFNNLSAGIYYYVVDATDATGKKLNLVKNKFTVGEGTSTLRISGASPLTSLKLGKAWTCNGTISSNYKITRVYGAILKSDGITVAYSKIANPYSKSYNLAGSEIDKALKFNNLSPGTYYYVVDATDATGKKLNLVKNKFSVLSGTSTLKISGNTVISSMIQGKSWTCNGTISSNYNITEVYGAILKSDGITVAYRKTLNPYVKSFKLAGSEIDKELKFNELLPGTYYYVVDATDATGKELNLVKNKFTIVKDEKKMYSNPVPADTIIGKGSGAFSNRHQAADFSAPNKSPIYALSNGVVVFSACVPVDLSGSYGNVVVIRHTDGSGYYSLYAHMNTRWVREGDTITKGQQIGIVGMTGEATGPHMHLELGTSYKKNGVWPNVRGRIDPLNYIIK